MTYLQETTFSTNMQHEITFNCYHWCLSRAHYTLRSRVNLTYFHF